MFLLMLDFNTGSPSNIIAYLNSEWKRTRDGELTYGGFELDKSMPYATEDYYFVFAPIQCRKEENVTRSS